MTELLKPQSNYNSFYSEVTITNGYKMRLIKYSLNTLYQLVFVVIINLFWNPCNNTTTVFPWIARAHPE